MTLRSKKVASFSPRGIVGHLNAQRDVVISNPFRQFLDQLRFRFEDSNEPAGMLRMTLSANEPFGWLLLNGQTVSARLYPDLAAIFGAAGDVVTLPDYSGRMAMGAGGSLALKGTAGAGEVTLAQTNLPNYNLTVTDTGHSHGVTDAGHAHAVTDAGHAHAVTDPGHGHAVTDPGHTHATGKTSPTNEAAAGTDKRISVSGNTGNSTTNLTIDSNTTGVTVDNATTGVTVDSATTGVSINNQTTGISVSSAGGGQAFGIIPPVFGVNWLVKA